MNYALVIFESEQDFAKREGPEHKPTGLLGWLIQRLFRDRES